MKLNKETNRKRKPVEPKIKQTKVNYNLEHLFDDDPFPDFKPVVTNDPFDKEMNKVRRMERKMNKMNETIENKYESLQTGNVVITYPKIDVPCPLWGNRRSAS